MRLQVQSWLQRRSALGNEVALGNEDGVPVVGRLLLQHEREERIDEHKVEEVRRLRLPWKKVLIMMEARVLDVTWLLGYLMTC